MRSRHPAAARRHNGSVWLLNPNGMLFGKRANINVGGLLATTAAITDSHFMNGNYGFTSGGNPDAAIINNGIISAWGGEAETSGNTLSVTGTVIAYDWLLDPNNVIIQAASALPSTDACCIWLFCYRVAANYQPITLNKEAPWKPWRK